MQRGIQQGIKLGLDVRSSELPPRTDRPARHHRRPSGHQTACVPTAQRARRLVYAPDLDGRADPGEIVWTWVVYEDDPTAARTARCSWWAVTGARCSA